MSRPLRIRPGQKKTGLRTKYLTFRCVPDGPRGCRWAFYLGNPEDAGIYRIDDGWCIDAPGVSTLAHKPSYDDPCNAAHHLEEALIKKGLCKKFTYKWLTLQAESSGCTAKRISNRGAVVTSDQPKPLLALADKVWEEFFFFPRVITRITIDGVEQSDAPRIEFHPSVFR